MTYRVFHFGCGKEKIHPVFDNPSCEEVRFDIDPSCNPDYVGNLLDSDSFLPVGTFDAAYGSHVLEHFYAHEVFKVLANIKKILKKDGALLIRVPDLEEAAIRLTSQPNRPVYISPAGPIYPLDMIYGYRPFIEDGNHFMQHKTGFTKESLKQVLEHSGYEVRKMWQGNFELMADCVSE